MTNEERIAELEQHVEILQYAVMTLQGTKLDDFQEHRLEKLGRYMESPTMKAGLDKNSTEE